jgi:hypothetical protein
MVSEGAREGERIGGCRRQNESQGKGYWETERYREAERWTKRELER